MKHFKRLFSYLVALTMVLSLAAFTGVKVHANTTTGNSLTIKNNGETAHTFELYQIFTGTKKSDSDTLGDIQWGSGVTPAGQTALGDAKEYAKKLDPNGNEKKTAEAFAKELVKGDGTNSYLTSPTESESIAANSSKKFDNLASGYYLVKDKEGTQTDAVKGAYTDFIVQVVGSVETTTKLNVPTTIKKVKENKKSVNTKNTDTDSKMSNVVLGDHYNDVADYNVGDDIPYELIGSLPTNYDNYDTYYYQFTDIMDKGLTSNNNVKVWYSNNNGKEWTEITSGFTASATSKYKNTDKTTFTVTFDNLKNIKVLNKDSKIKVTFTAKLNADAVYGNPGNVNESYLKYSNNVNDVNGKGETPHDKVVVFTYELDTTKVDADEPTKNLKGAHFIVLDSDGKNAKYLVQTKDQYGKVTANTWTTKESEATDFESGTDGKFAIKGLDDGTYYLQETKAPDGYNTDSTLHKVTINATTSNGQTWDGISDALTVLNLVTNTSQNSGDIGTGTVSDQITNSKGSTLPSTGGMGTTLLYAAGGILVACAAAYVIMSKKKSAKK